MTTASLRALLRDSIDYAGMFPPAELSLEESLRNYFEYEDSPHSWMLGAFVCPAESLEELIELEQAWKRGVSRLSLVVTKRWQSDAPKSLREWCNSCGEIDRSFCLETKMNTDPIAAHPLHAAFHGAVLRTTGTIAWNHVDSFCKCEYVEPPPHADDAKLRVLARLASEKHEDGVRLKFRTGGATADTVPTADHLANIFRICLDEGVAWKLTAGLHQPLLHVDDELQTAMHGFVNVLAAAVLGHARDLDAKLIAAVLNDDYPPSFMFDEDFIRWRWRTLRATIDEIETARHAAMVSFGSCSFQEPVAGLQSLGWL